MDRKRKPALGKCRSKLSFLIGLTEFLYISSLGYVLYINQGDCSQPIRFWLECLLAAFSIHFTIYLLSEFLSPLVKNCQGILSLSSALINILLSLFTLVWIVLGSYWYYSSEVCSSTFYEGDLAVYLILIVYYTFLLLGCCLGCIMWILMYIGKGITTEVKYY